MRDKGKAKVNVLIKEKLDKRKKYSRDSTRKRRNPVSVIEYYDYDSDNEQRERETGEQERLKTSYDKNPIESDAGLGNFPHHRQILQISSHYTYEDQYIKRN